jgi:hypothetical protein
MQNVCKDPSTTCPKTTGTIGPGLVNLDAMTYLELIV